MATACRRSPARKRAAALGVSTVLATVCAAPAMAAPPKTLDAQVAAILADGGAPGLAIGIVEHGKVTWAKGYGVRRLGRPERVDARTLFQIGSTTKAFTAAALAMLVDEGKLAWDDKVADRLPGFQLSDPTATRAVTVRDLLAHRTGLRAGEGDLMGLPRSDFSRDEEVHNLRFFKLAAPVGTTYAYNNMGYIAAGAVLEKVSGRRWEDFTRSRILRPLGMTASTTEEGAWLARADRAWAHDHRPDPAPGLGPMEVLDPALEVGAAIAPAGIITSNVEEMSRWIAVQLAHGRRPAGAALWTPARTDDMWAASVAIPLGPLPPELAEATPHAASYGLGWDLIDWRGHRMLIHAGGTMGFRSVIALLPDEDVGFVILQNSVDAEVVNPIRNLLLDHYTKSAPVDWPSRYAALKRKRLPAAQDAVKLMTPPPGAKPPSLAASTVTGDFAVNWYGRVTVREAAGVLEMRFTRTAQMSARLTPFDGDTYLARWRNPMAPICLVSFRSGPGGQADSIDVRPLGGGDDDVIHLERAGGAQDTLPPQAAGR